MRPSAPPILALLLVLAAVPPLRAAQPDAPTPSAEPPKADAAMANWVRQVHAIVLKATNPLTRRLKLGVYRVSFTVDDRGRGSNYDAKGDQSDAKQSSMIMGALISRSFPAPPDGASHAVSFTLRNGTPVAKPSTGKPSAAKPEPSAAKPEAGATPPADGKPAPEGAKP